MRDERVRLTDVVTRRLQSLVAGGRPADLRDADSIALLERHVDQAEVLPATLIDADIVTMDSEVVVRDLDTHQTIVFRVVFPAMANAAARRISVLAPSAWPSSAAARASTSTGRRWEACVGSAWIASEDRSSGMTSSDALALVVSVARACGTVEVRVSGPEATLRLFFDPWDVPPIDGQVVRAAVARYRSSLSRSAP